VPKAHQVSFWVSNRGGSRLRAAAVFGGTPAAAAAAFFREFADEEAAYVTIQCDAVEIAAIRYQRSRLKEAGHNVGV
jgi:hypothetical protein